PRTIMPIDQAVEVIVVSGGVPVLAHPFQYKKTDAELRELIKHCMDHGLKGMECRYSGYGPDQVAYLEALAEEYGLVKTGGSDFHGDNKPHIKLGTGMHEELDVPYEWLERLKETAGK
ncbi:MAG: PHP domain-containing protein, partial [Oscillospiraceae bacterium]|nr:PHP domain-containing protein [Oscillospiraceae bacterium]